MLEAIPRISDLCVWFLSRGIHQLLCANVIGCLRGSFSSAFPNMLFIYIVNQFHGRRERKGDLSSLLGSLAIHRKKHLGPNGGLLNLWCYR